MIVKEHEQHGRKSSVHLISHRGEGQGIREMQTHHHHPCHPKKQNIQTGFEQLGGIKRFEIVGLIGPSEDGEGEQTGAEPSVQYVFILV